MLLLETAPSVLAIIWFLLIAVLWIGFFFLEGFDFGVGMLGPILGKDEKKRRVLINTIGPHWDGNEVWLLTAGGATFAAFPGWYSTLFSALYLPLFLVLVGLILRGVAFEYRAKGETLKFAQLMDWFSLIGSFLPVLVLGVGFANFVIGLPNDGLLFNGTFFGLFTPFALLGGVLFVVLFLTHGATFVTLKTSGEIKDSARAFVAKAGWVAVALLAVFVICQNIFWPAVSEWANLSLFAWIFAILAIAALAGSVYMTSMAKREGWGFILGGVAILAMVAGIFLRMFGNIGFAQPAGKSVTERLNIVTAASSETTLTIMTVAAVVFVPIVLAYQAWSYWVFHRRLSTKHIPDAVEPVA